MNRYIYNQPAKYVTWTSHYCNVHLDHTILVEYIEPSQLA